MIQSQNIVALSCHERDHLMTNKELTFQKKLLMIAKAASDLEYCSSPRFFPEGRGPLSREDAAFNKLLSAVKLLDTDVRSMLELIE
jgi:hypothetical protein